MENLGEHVEQPQNTPEEQAAIQRYRESTGQAEAPSEADNYNEDGTLKEELIAGKFKSQDELLKAYQELEKKLSQPKEEPKQPEASQENLQEKVDEATASGKLDLNKYGNEIVSNGGLSEASYKELEGFGFSKQDVDNYIKGQQLLGQSFTNSIYEKAGGQEQYTELVTWAADSMPQSLIEEYNYALSTQNTDKVIQLVEYMKYKYSEAGVTPPRRLEGDAESYGGVKPFADKNEWQKAQTNRLYGKDKKYTEMVDKRYLTSRKRGIL